MTRVYENNSFSRRQNIYVVILALVILNGCWELYSALSAPDGSTSGMAFGLLFIAGGLYGIYQTMVDGRDLVAALDVDGTTATVTLWRPFQKISVAAELDEIRDWRFWVKTGQSNQRGYYIFADFPNYPRKLQFELQSGKPPSDGFRAIAPRAVADFEERTGTADKEAEAPPTAPA